MAITDRMGHAADGAPAVGTAARRSIFGTLSDGTVIEAVTLTAANGVRARIISYGAMLQALEVPDRAGNATDVTLGYDRLSDYVERPNVWGQTIGRYANRIAGGRFVLDGTTYRLPPNDGGNALHGGADGFDKRAWRIVSVAGGAQASVTLALTSPAGDQGFRGTLRVTTTYALDGGGNLTQDLDATSDAPTIVNLTNHTVFNLGGEGSARGVMRHRQTIPASHYTPVDTNLIPSRELTSVTGTVFDFTQGRIIEDGIRDGRDPQIVIGRGLDRNFVLDAGRTAEPKLAARLEDPSSGRVLGLLSDQPGLQVHTSNFLDGTAVGKNGHLYRMGDGIALEPQLFPDTPNRPAFGSARVAPDAPYHHSMIFRVFAR